LVFFWKSGRKRQRFFYHFLFLFMHMFQQECEITWLPRPITDTALVDKTLLKRPKSFIKTKYRRVIWKKLLADHFPKFQRFGWKNADD
jgi:hypothetical protein